MAERTVLHVLPHPGGGGETYVDTLEAMLGYDFTRLYLGPGPGPSVSLAGGVMRALREARHHDVVHVHGEAAGGLCLPALAARPSVVTLHGLHLLRRTSALPHRLSLLNLRLVMRAASRTICVSRAERDAVVRSVGRALGGRAVVVHNGVRTSPASDRGDAEALRLRLGIPVDAVVAIMVGSLDMRKDPLTAVKAAERTSTVLLVVGEGPLRERVARSSGELVHVLGGRADVRDLLRAADLFVLPSSREGLSFALLEAMAAALPCVVVDIPENIEALGEAAIAVPAGDVDAFSNGFVRLRDELEREKLGRAARSRVAELFRIEDMLERTRAVYDEVIGEPAA
jgi:glycosyltransferase involved in cell wall biosynthesis